MPKGKERTREGSRWRKKTEKVKKPNTEGKQKRRVYYEHTVDGKEIRTTKK